LLSCLSHLLAFLLLKAVLISYLPPTQLISLQLASLLTFLLFDFLLLAAEF
jgi:hypothetical protein